MKDFQPLAWAGSTQNALVVRNDLGVSNVRELLDHARKNPGKLNFGSTGSASSIAVTGASRAPPLPQVPTVAEAGVPGYEVYVWFGMEMPGRFAEGGGRSCRSGDGRYPSGPRRSR